MRLPPLAIALGITLGPHAIGLGGLDPGPVVARATGLGIAGAAGMGSPAAAGGALEAALAGVAGAMLRRRGLGGPQVDEAHGKGRGSHRRGGAAAGDGPRGSWSEEPPGVVRVVEARELRAVLASARDARARQEGPRALRTVLHRAMGLGPPAEDRRTTTAASAAADLPAFADFADDPTPDGAIYDLPTGRVLVAGSEWRDLAPSPTDPDTGGQTEVDAAFPALPSLQSFLLCHALALQILDRHFDLGPFLRGERGPAPASTGSGPPRPAADDADGLDPDDGDAAVARQALVEGDALLQALEQTLPSGTPSVRGLTLASDRARAAVRAEAELDPQPRGEIPSPSSAPAARAGLDWTRHVFPQTAGVAFVAAFRARSAWSEVDRTLWAHPPASSEQVLHPEAYLRGELPDPVARRLPESAAALGPFRVEAEDTLGELGARAFLAPSVGEYRAVRAAAGWGGDRAVWLVSGTEAFAAWVTTWDDETDARDFAEQATVALAALAESRPDADPMDPDRAPGRPASQATDRAGEPPTGWRAFVDPAGRRFAIETAPRTVGLLFASPEAGYTVLRRLVAAATPPATSAAASAASGAAHVTGPPRGPSPASALRPDGTGGGARPRFRSGPGGR